MKFHSGGFNIFSLLACLLALGTGCQTGPTDKKASLRLHLQVNPDESGRTVPVPVYRANPMFMVVEREPFLHEGQIVNAALIDVLGGFEIQVQFDRKGTWILEQYTTGYKDRRIVVFSQFGEARWLGAPLITRRITDGVFTFTPDATREEAERIVRGLSLVAKAVRKRMGGE